LSLSPSTDYDAVLARELANQLGLGCRGGVCTNQLVLSVLKEKNKPDLGIQPTEGIHATNTSKFAQLDIDDESSVSSNDEEKKEAPNNLLQELALEREKRQNEQLKVQSAKPPQSKKKKKKKAKGKAQKLGGTTQSQKEESNDKLDDLDDMAFLDAQINKVQSSHGRKIEAKGKGYRSIVNGILLSTPSQKEEPKRNSAASSNLQAKIKSKTQGRKVKKKSK